MSPPSTEADRNLLFAALALRADRLTPERFVEACSALAGHPDLSLSCLAAERGWLSPDEIADVERLVEEQVKKHGGSARAGLAEVTQDLEVRQTLDNLPAGSDSLLATGPHHGPGPDVPLPAEGERYTVTRLHATGGIGRVWLARDGALGRDVALKDLRPERSENPAVWGRFLREAQITGQLEHPGIVPIYELGRRAGDGRPYYTMRFIRGRTFREAIAAYHQKRAAGTAGRLELRELLNAFLGVCNALAYAHSRGVVHRDLKPANVVLGEFGEVMVLDWGLAKSGVGGPEADAAGGETSHAPVLSGETAGDGDPSQTLDGSVLGTPAYMAPEQAEGKIAAIDARTDVYGLGAILYELLTGRPPFTGNSAAEVLTRVRTQPPERPGGLARGTPRPLEAICLKALSKRPEDRYGGAKALAADVSRFLADEPTVAYREPLATRAWRWARRHRLIVTGLVAAFVVATPILAAGVALLNESGRRERAATKQAEKNAKEAQEKYRQALRAADALAEDIARGIRPIAGTQSRTVIDILDRVKRISDGLFTDIETTPEALQRKARILTQLCEMYRETNQSQRSRTSAEEAIAIFDQLLVLHPDDRTLRTERAKVRNRVGWALYDQLFLDEALAAFRESVRELEAVGAETDPLLATKYLASGITFEGNILMLRGDMAGAEAAYRRGLDLRRRAAAVLDGDPEARVQLALSYERYGRFLCLTDARRKDEGLAMLRAGKADMEAACAADAWDGSRHFQLVKLLTALAETETTRDAAFLNVAEAEKVVNRFLGRDPDHMLWRREQLRVDYFRIASRLRIPGLLSTPDRLRLRYEELRVLGEMLAVIEKLHTHDRENYMWLRDRANLESRIARSYLSIIEEEDRLPAVRVGWSVAAAALSRGRAAELPAAAFTARAEALAHTSRDHYRPILARCPWDTEVEGDSLAPLYTLWLAAGDRRDRAAVARWTHDAEQIAFIYRITAAFPNVERWRRRCVEEHYKMRLQGERIMRDPDWAVLKRPDVVATLLRLAAVVADMPPGIPADLREELLPYRQWVGTALRDFDAKGLLPPEGKAILARLP